MQIGSMKDDTENQISFELLADANQRLLRRILAEPLERPCEGDTLRMFQDMQAANRNEPAKSHIDGRHGS